MSRIQEQARGLPWGDERPWRTRSHLRIEAGLPTIDLHDLDLRLALEVTRICLATGSTAGGLRLVTGRGRHNPSGSSPLREAVRGYLRRAAADSGALLRMDGPGAFIYITDAARAGPSAAGALGWLFWLGVTAFLALAAWVCAGTPRPG